MVCAVIGVALLAGALAGGLSAGLSAGGQLHVSDRQVAAGVGGGPSLSWQAGSWRVHGGLDGLLYSVPALSLRAGVERTWRPEMRLQPGVGLSAAATWGSVKRLSAEYPAPIRGPAGSLALHLRPLVWSLEAHRISAAEIWYGRALEAPLSSHVAGLTLLSIQRRF